MKYLKQVRITSKEKVVSSVFLASEPIKMHFTDDFNIKKQDLGKNL